MNILTILIALEALEYFSLFFFNNTLLFAKIVNFPMRFKEIKEKYMMLNLVIVGLQE